MVIKGDDKDNSNNNNNSNNAKRGLEMIQTLPFISPVPVNSRITGRSVMSDHLTQYIKNRIIVPQRPA